MADKNLECVILSSESDESEEKDPRLDFFSDKFDPILALNTLGIKKLPNTTAKAYDNLSAYQSATDENVKLLKTRKEKSAEASTSKVERRFLPHQMPVKSTKVKKRHDVLTRMEAMQGPLSLVKKCIDENLRVEIRTRHAKGVRGYCYAHIVAFDKYWNLALEKVTERWTRPKKRKIPAFDSVQSDIKPKRKIKLPKVTVLPHKTDKKLEYCVRQVHGLLMRGEHIVLIRVIPKIETTAD